MKKKFVSIFVLFVLALSISAGALEPVTNEETQALPSVFIEKCDLLFSGSGKIYTHNGEDVTQLFCTTYMSTYKVGDYVAIRDACRAENISYIKTYRENTLAMPRLSMTKSYEESELYLVENKEFPYKGKTWYFEVKATGSFTYNDGNFQISSFPNPTIEVAYYDTGSLFAGSLTSMTTTTPRLNSSKNSASFTVTTKHTMSCPIPDVSGGTAPVTGTLGPFTYVSNFTISL